MKMGLVKRAGPKISNFREITNFLIVKNFYRFLNIREITNWITYEYEPYFVKLQITS